MQKTALIVDDSRSARVVLKKMLQAHEIGVDTAESAEDALIYLSDHRPDVIFMDHLMPGMDGFEAVSAIKNNPDTATIPIMMYTSQEGELYVGQARALGAVGVLPKQVEPVEVSKVLQSLRVIGGNGNQDTARTDGDTDALVERSGELPGLETLDYDLRLLIQGLFDQQRAVLRRDLLDSYETIATRVADEIRPKEEQEEAEVDPVNEPSRVLHGVIAALVLTAVVLAGLYWQRAQNLQALQAQHSQMQLELVNQRSNDASATRQTEQQLDEYQETISTMFTTTVASLEWAANQNSSYSFDELPLGDTRLAIVEQLAARLVSLDFLGVVRIETHVGDYCVLASGPDGNQLAPATIMAESCDQIGMSSSEAHELGLRQSIAFANFIRLAEQSFGGKIRYEIISLGNSDPLVPYPVMPDGVSASIWNEIAAINNRVELSIYADNF